MFLSKVLISACRNPYEIHRKLWELFPEDADAERDFLFRVEKADNVQVAILMQSERKPLQSHGDARLVACREYPLSLKLDQKLRFLLVANPVKTIDDERGRKNSKEEIKKCRVPLINEEAQREWIIRKLEKAALFESLMIDNRSPLYFRKNRDNRTGKIQPVIFQGVIKVQDAIALQDLVRWGIGPAKAFGCGLLSLAMA